jgi:predicted nucleic acid-binding protein
MTVAVDSSVLFEIIKGGSKAAKAQQALEHALSQGAVCVCEAVLAELGRYFQTTAHLEQFLQACQLDYSALSRPSALAAAGMMRQYAINGGKRTRVVADFLIGAHALHQADELLTLDAGFFREYFEGLSVVDVV